MFSQICFGFGDEIRTSAGDRAGLAEMMAMEEEMAFQEEEELMAQLLMGGGFPGGSGGGSAQSRNCLRMQCHVLIRSRTARPIATMCRYLKTF